MSSFLLRPQSLAKRVYLAGFDRLLADALAETRGSTVFAQANRSQSPLAAIETITKAVCNALQTLPYFPGFEIIDFMKTRLSFLASFRIQFNLLVTQNLD